METKLELGPIQTAWLKSLRDHPERQTTGILGSGTPENYNACCLGELHVVACRMNKQPAPFVDNVILNNSEAVLIGNWREYGLYNASRAFSSGYEVKLGRGFYTLSDMNDGGYTWVEIADFIEANPELVFSKSV